MSLLSRFLMELAGHCFLMGGMGINVSGYALANAMSLTGKSIGTVSGTAIGVVFVRRLQDGDKDGNLRRAVESFPSPYYKKALEIYDNYYIPGGKKADKPYMHVEMFSLQPSKDLIWLTVLANYCEVWLAKEGHKRPVFINYLEKVQMPHLFSLFGAILATIEDEDDEGGLGIAVGAGLGTQFPKIIDGLLKGETVRYKLDVKGAGSGEFFMEFNPREFFPDINFSKLKRPLFAPIVSTTLAAKAMVRAVGKEAIDLFIIEDYEENPVAGGHSGKPRRDLGTYSCGELIYTEEDRMDLNYLQSLDIPYIMAGGFSSPESAEKALSYGAVGFQGGSICALSAESGIVPYLRQLIISMIFAGTLRVFSNPASSPTGFPFEEALIPGTLSDSEVYNLRPRVCDLGFLRELYIEKDGILGYRCPAESIKTYVKKGGGENRAKCAKCLCNALLANTGLGQIRKGGYVEPPLITLGKILDFVIKIFAGKDALSYSAQDLVDYLFPKR